jgi:hypothetical protein
MLQKGQVVVGKDLLFVAGDEIVEQDRGKLFLEDFLIEMAKEHDDIIAEKSPRARDKESLSFEVFDLVLEALREPDDVFPDDLRFIKTLVVRLSFGHKFLSFGIGP